jgi:hypothetical protein
MRLNYGCGDGLVVGDPDRSSPVWRVFYAPREGSGNLVQVDVRVAWY